MLSFLFYVGACFNVRGFGWRAFCALVIAALLTGCNASNPVKNTPLDDEVSPYVSSQQLYEQGAALYKKWSDDETESAQTLYRGASLLTQAYQLQPQNVLYQSEYYNAFVSMQVQRGQIDEGALLQVFNALHPLIKMDVVTPAFVSLTFADASNLTADQRVAYMLRAVQQNPRNPQNWYLLSREYVSANQFSLATVAAKHALDAVPEAADYAFQFGATLAYSKEQSGCIYEHKPAIKTAAKHLAKAVSGSPNNPTYLSLLARQYLHLGITPLAFAQAKKAYEIEPKLQTGRTYFYAALLSNQYDDVKVAMDYLSKNHRKRTPLEYALYAWLDGSEDVSDALVKADTWRGTLFHAYNADYFIGASAEEFAELIDAFDMETPVTQYILGRSELSDDAFVATAINRCEKSKFLFYSAMNLWRDGDDEAFKKALKRVQKQKTPLSLASLWAQSILLK